MTRKQLKKRAKVNLKGNIGYILVCTIITAAIPFVCSLIGTGFGLFAQDYSSIIDALLGVTAEVSTPVAEFVETTYPLWLQGLLETLSTLSMVFVVLPLTAGYLNVFRHLRNDNNDKNVGYLFETFKKQYYWKVIGLSILSALMVMAWSLLFIIPGIIKGYAYSQAMYILLDNPKIKVIDAITKSRKMMKGNKWRLFVLELSFILWALLDALTLGILGLIYLSPYQQLTFIEFHYDVERKK